MITDKIDPKILEYMRQKHEKRKIMALHYEHTINDLIQNLEETASTKDSSPNTPPIQKKCVFIQDRLKKQSGELKKSRESLDNLDSYGYSPNNYGSSADNLDIDDENQEEKPQLPRPNKLCI